MAEEFVCSSCGYKGNPQARTKGNILIEIILWLFVIIPGLIYSIWRLTSKQKVCPRCSQDAMIPVNSPMGQKILSETKKYDKEPTYHQPVKRSNMGAWIIGAIVLILAIPILSALFSSPSPAPTTSTTQEEFSEIKILPIRELIAKTEQQIKKDYADIITNYSEGHKTPSGKILITGFDMGDTNVQIDYNIATGKPYYVGYHFTNGVDEYTAWKIVGFDKPTSASIKQKIVTWENIDTVKPFKNVTLIYNPNDTVGKIAFSMEDLATAQSSKSLYYTR